MAARLIYSKSLGACIPHIENAYVRQDIIMIKDTHDIIEQLLHIRRLYTAFIIRKYKE